MSSFCIQSEGTFLRGQHCDVNQLGNGISGKLRLIENYEMRKDDNAATLRLKLCLSLLYFFYSKPNN